MLVIGATTRVGHGLVEALLAMGAEVIATSPVRTQLDQLSADMHQHERLRQADLDPTDADALLRLMTDASRDAPLDSIVLVLESSTPWASATRDPQKALRRMIESTFESACWVLRAGVTTMAKARRGRIIVLTEGTGMPDPETPIQAAMATAVRTLIESNRTPVAAQGVGLLGLSTHAFQSRPAALAERVLDFIDPEQPLPSEAFI